MCMIQFESRCTLRIPTAIWIGASLPWPTKWLAASFRMGALGGQYPGLETDNASWEIDAAASEISCGSRWEKRQFSSDAAAQIAAAICHRDSSFSGGDSFSSGSPSWAASGLGGSCCHSGCEGDVAAATSRNAAAPERKQQRCAAGATTQRQQRRHRAVQHRQSDDDV